MRTRTWAVLAAAAFCLILLNALYGHHVYGSPYGQALTKYLVYVHLQPGWQSAPANIMYDVTVSWDGHTIPGDAYNSNYIQTQHGRETVVLQHGFSDCKHGWSPPLYRYGVDLLRSHMHYMMGLQLDTDPYTPRLPDVASARQDTIQYGHAQFIPVCGGGGSYVYSVGISDPTVAFDVYFVPSYDALVKYLDGRVPVAYCMATGRMSHTGFCEGVGPDSGLLVILPDSLDKSVTKITVSMRQVTSNPDA